MAEFEWISKSGATEVESPRPPLDFSYYFSRVTASREASNLKFFYKYFLIPGIGNLAGGLPNASFFPYETLEAQAALPDRFKPTPNDPKDPSKSIGENLTTMSIDKHQNIPSSHVTVPLASGLADPLHKIDLKTALQYGTAEGYPPLHSFLRQFTRQNLHPNVPYLNGPEIVLTNGNTDGLAKVIEALSNVWSKERDWIREREGILCEEFAYMNAIQTVRPRGLQVVPVKIDSEGMLAAGPGGLQDVLENWDDSKGKRPHLMYTVTIGQNPTGGTLSIQRRKDIYAVCSKYDVMIIEDDPYWNLQFPSAAGKEAEARGTIEAPVLPAHKFEKSSGYPFLDSLVPSSLNIDVDGRVIRLDTFSKIVAPGCRLGWITAQPAIIERIVRITESSTQQPSGFVQSIIAQTIMGPQPSVTNFNKKSRREQISFTGWETDGLVRWLSGLRGQYERRMHKMCSHLEDGRFILKQGTPVKASESDWAVISKTQMYSFEWPRAGMFIWMRMHFETHPLAGTISGSVMASSLWAFLTRRPYLVLAAPGLLFSPTEEIAEKEGWKYFRLCFAAVEEDELERTSKGFAEGTKAFWLIKDKKELEDIQNQVQENHVHEELLNLGVNWGC